MTEGRILNYGRQHLDADDIEAVVAVLKSDFLTQGPVVEQFEAEFAKAVGARHAVAVTSGTAALHVACLAAGLEPGIWGVTSTLTFVASANALIYCGAEAALCDIDEYGLNISASALARSFASRAESRVVVTVDFGGLAQNSAEIRRLAGNRLVIEDAAHALGASYETGAPVGSCAFADMTVFSFHPVKSITAGEGGMVTTNDEELYRRLLLFRNHGIERSPERHVSRPGAGTAGEERRWYYEQQALGFNYRLSDIHAALGLSQLAKLDRFVARRREIAARYDAALAPLPGLILYQARREYRARSATHLYVVGFDRAVLKSNRSDLMSRLRERRINGQVHYIPVHRHPYHRQRYGHDLASFPRAEAYYETCVTLPLHADLTDEEAERVVNAVTEAVGEVCG